MGSDEVRKLSDHINDHRLAGSQVIDYDDEEIVVHVRDDCSCGPNQGCDRCGGKKDPAPTASE